MSAPGIVEATPADLLDIDRSGELGRWRIAVWPGTFGIPNVLASDADVVKTTKATVLWQRIVSVHANTHAVVVETSDAVYRTSPNDRRFVIREAS